MENKPLREITDKDLEQYEQRLDLATRKELADLKAMREASRVKG